MRKVYHGSTTVIKYPLVNIGRDNLDFGKGFYVTDIRKQAKIWAEIKSRYELDGQAIINEYELDFDKAISEYRYMKFEKYDKEWLQFIISSRSGKKEWRKYDIIEGGVANDKVIDTVEAYIAGQIDEIKALGELAKHQPNNQICILKQAIIDKHLKYISSKIIK